MDEVLLRQLVRQMKLFNFWITVFGTLFFIALLIAGFLLYQVASFMRDTKQNLESLKNNTSQTMDLQKRVCASDLKNLLSEAGEYCK